MGGGSERTILSATSGPAGAGQDPVPAPPPWLLIISPKTKSYLDISPIPRPEEELCDVLAAIYDYLEASPVLEERSIYHTRLGQHSILMESCGRVLFAGILEGMVEREHYRAFHRAVKLLLERCPMLGTWSGRTGELPVGIAEGLRSALRGRRPPHAAEAPAPAPSRAELEALESKMREWYRKGYSVSMLRDALHHDIRHVVKAFQDFELRIERLEEIKMQLSELEREGFETDVRRIRLMLSDPSRMAEIEGVLAAIQSKARASSGVRLPLSDKAALAEAIRSLPLGVPSALWGTPVEALVEEILSAERGVTPDGVVVVKLRGGWHVGDALSPDFLRPYSGEVRWPQLGPPAPDPL